MVIPGERVRLRDRRMADFEDYVRWFAPGQEWQKWDAPWEGTAFQEDESQHRQLWRERLADSPPEPRSHLEIETVQGRHIGWVTRYWVCEETDWCDCGIVICEDDLWGQGLGREAFALWLDYVLTESDLPRIGMGTWSGNERMLRVAARVGLRGEARFADARLVEGRRYAAVRWGVTRAEWERYKAPRTDGLRRYTPVDWDAAVDLTRQLFDYHRALQAAPSFPVQAARETVYGWLARQDSVLWVWQERGEVVGLARARYDGVYFGEEFVVSESHRGRGIGKRFLRALEDELREVGEQDLFLSMVWPGNPAAIDFYRHQGYDVLNTFELRKGLRRDRRGREIEFLGSRFFLSVQDA